MGEVAKALKKFNIVVPQKEFIVPRSCEYYLHFNINLPYPERELNTCIANQKNGKKNYQKRELAFNQIEMNTTKLHAQ